MSFLKKAVGLVIGAVGAVVGFMVGGPAGALIGFSIGMGIGSAAQMMAMQTKVPEVSSATSSRLNVSIDPDARRKIAFGETALGTDQVYWETFGPENSYYDQVIIAAGHMIEAFGDLYFDDELVTFSGDIATGAYAGALYKDDRVVGMRGGALQAGAGVLWNANTTLTGCAHYSLKIRWSQENIRAEFQPGSPAKGRVRLSMTRAVTAQCRVDPERTARTIRTHGNTRLSTPMGSRSAGTRRFKSSGMKSAGVSATPTRMSGSLPVAGAVTLMTSISRASSLRPMSAKSRAIILTSSFPQKTHTKPI